MAQFPLGLVLVAWVGPTTPVASAPWKNNVGGAAGGIFKENTLRTSFVSYKSTSSYPIITQLQQGGIYLFRVTTAFSLPDSDAVTAVLPASSANQPPTVALFLSSNTAAPGSSVTLTATANDPDGTIAKVEYFNGATKIGESFAGPTFSYVYGGLVAGSYALTAKATDNAGGTTTSTAQSLSVAAAANQLPVVTLALSSASVVAGQPVTLTATATDPDGSIAQVEFFSGSTPLATDLNNPYSYVFTPATAGAYALTAKATDNAGGFTTSDSQALTVTAPTSAFSLLPASTDYFDNANYYAADTIIGGRKKPNPFARLKLSVSAAGTLSVPVTSTSLNQDLTSAVTVFKNGAWFTTLKPSQQGVEETLPLVADGPGEYVLNLGAQGRAYEQGDITFSSLGTITAPASMGVSRIAPTKKNRAFITYTDSVGVGARSNDAGRYGWHQKVRVLNPEVDVPVMGYAGRYAYAALATPELRATQITQIAALCQGVAEPFLWFQLGINDYAFNTADPTTWAAAIKAFFQELHTAIPALNIFWASPTPITNTGANTYSKYLEDYRTAAASAALGLSYVLYVNGNNLGITTADLDDNAHPTNAGYDKLGLAINNVFNTAVFPVVQTSNFVKYTLSDSHVTLLPNEAAWTKVPDGGGGNVDIGYTQAAGGAYLVTWPTNAVRLEIYTTKQENGQNVTITENGGTPNLINTLGPGYPSTPELVYQSPTKTAGSGNTTLVEKGGASSLNYYHIKVYTS